MPRLSVAPSGSHLLADGDPFPLVADTLWVAFADLTSAEWRHYLATRRQQGFTAVMASLLPIAHDRDLRPTSRSPFPLAGDGAIDVTTVDESYFETVREYTRIAHEEYGLRMMVVLLWNNYQPGTWGSRVTPDVVLTAAIRERILTLAIKSLAEFEPILVIGGDDDYDAPDANALYLAAIDRIRTEAPGCLITTHPSPKGGLLPEALADRLDFYLYQSGHNVDQQDLAAGLARDLSVRVPRRPVVNAEPPYEHHGRVNGSGRWSTADVRRASWVSVLSGAGAGIGYGAHGVWMWHTPEAVFLGEQWSLEPYGWPQALQFPGALDISLLREIVQRHRLWDVTPRPDLLTSPGAAQPPDGLPLLATDADMDVVAIYLPHAVAVETRLDLAAHRLHGWDLATRVPIVPQLGSDGSRLRQPAVTGDCLIIAERL